MGRQLPDDVRKGYEEQFRNRQKYLKRKSDDYKDSGCGNPPLVVPTWIEMEVPVPPQPSNDGLLGDALVLLLISEGLRILFPPRNAIPVL